MSTAAREKPTTRRRRSPTRRPRSPARGGAKRRPTRKLRRRRTIAGVVLAGGLAALVVSQLHFFEDTIREVTLPLQHEDIIRQQAADKGVDAELIAAVIYAESRFRDQTSTAGARGLMQITPATAREIARRSGGTTFDPSSDLSDPQINIQYGSFHLRELLDLYRGNEVAALAAYNAGPAKVDEWGGADLEAEDIAYAETRDYVGEVLTKRDEYREHYAGELGLD